jgi:DNA polymerase III subunit delta
MEIKSHQADRFVARPPKELVAALLYGPDQGLVRERAETLAKTVVPDLKDPFRVTELDEGSLGSDPARLFDEASALSMMGGRRVVRVRGANNGHAELFESFLEQPPPGDALVVVEGGDLGKSAALRKAFEEAENGAAIPCYLDNEDSLGEMVRSVLKAHGLSIEPEALDEAIAALGSDRGVSRLEIEKLALYVHGNECVKVEDVRAVIGDEAEARVEEVCDAAGEGDLPKLDRALERLWTAGLSEVAILRMAMSHFQRLALAKSFIARGEPADTALKRLRPPVFYQRAASFKSQLARWSEEGLNESLDLLLDTEALCKTTAIPTEAVCGRALFTIAAKARGSRR